jgi:molybdopterin-guanine dinucleotide biosynthesis protein A
MADSDPRAAGFVLAGGQSSRMGRDKALVEFAGQPLIARALSTLREAGLNAAIAGSSPKLQSDFEPFAPIVDDREPGRGPLAGVCAALASTSARHAVFLSIDMPLLPASLLAYLLRHACITESAVTVASVNGRAQTFPAVLDRRVLPLFEAELKAGRLGCLAAFEAAAAALNQPADNQPADNQPDHNQRLRAIPVEFLVQSGQAAHPDGLPAAQWFLNLNSPADLARAETLLAGPMRRTA